MPSILSLLTPPTPPQVVTQRVKYLFTNLLTGEVIDEIPVGSVEMSNKLNGFGVLRGVFSLDMSGKKNADVLAASIPGKCGLIVERQGQPIWDGVIWSRWYQSQAKSVQFTARTLEGLWDKLYLRTDINYTSYEQRNIFREIINNLQLVAPTNLRVSVPSAFPDAVLRSVNVLATEYKTYLAVISSMADGASGFDWTISTNKNGVVYERKLLIGYPTLGATGDGLTFDYPGNVTNYYASESVDSAGTHMFVFGAGEGSDMVVGTAVQQDLIDSNWPRLDVGISRKDISNSSQISSLASQLGYQRRPPMLVAKLFVKEDQDPVFGSYGLGDLATISIVDPRFPKPGKQIQARMVAYNYRPTSDSSVGEVELVFEGDDLNGQ